MRNHIFKAWDPVDKKMIYGFDFLYEDMVGYVIGIENGVLTIEKEGDGRKLIPLQYSGRGDINGKEACEGDILQTFSNDGSKGRIGVVEYNEKGTSFFLKSKEGKKNYNFDLDCYHSFEIIGTVFENPELLKGKWK